MYVFPSFSSPQCLFALDARLLEITQLGLNPIRAPTPTQEHSENSPEVAAEAAEPSVEDGPEMSASNPPVVVSTSGSFDFMQASELEPPFEENAEWVERSDAVGHQEEQVAEPVNGHIQSDEPNTTVAPAEETVSLRFYADPAVLRPYTESSSRPTRRLIGPRTTRKVDCRL